MLYMCGSRLESLHGYASAALQQLLFCGADTQRMNVVVMTGGARRWHSDASKSASQVVVLHNTHFIIVDGNTVRSSREENVLPQYALQWEGEAMNMGDPGTLTAFLDYCVANFPARQYALMLWSGMGSPADGLGADELFDDDFLTIDELTAALDASAFSGDARLSWIAPLASLMGNLDVAAACAPYAERMIADEGLGDSFDFGFLEGLEDDLGGETVMRAMIDGYAEDPIGGDGMPRSMACLALDAVGEVVRARDALLEALKNEGLSAGLKMKLLKGEADDSPLRLWASYGLFDLGLLSEKLSEQLPAECAALREALDGAIVYQRANIVGPAGVSTYL